MKIYITGVSGSGKSSIARYLRDKGVFAVDIDDEFAQWVNKNTKQPGDWNHERSDEWYSQHGWTCNIEKLKQLLSENENIVVVGAAVNQDEYLLFFDKIYFLDVPPETMIARMIERTDNPFGKNTVEQNRVILWQKSYGKEMREKGAISIDAEGTLEEIAKIIIANLN